MSTSSLKTTAITITFETLSPSEKVEALRKQFETANTEEEIIAIAQAAKKARQKFKNMIESFNDEMDKLSEGCGDYQWYIGEDASFIHADDRFDPDGITGYISHRDKGCSVRIPWINRW